MKFNDWYLIEHVFLILIISIGIIGITVRDGEIGYLLGLVVLAPLFVSLASVISEREIEI